jgi:predicted lipoprotein with Yx(FWY)xxD motif
MRTLFIVIGLLTVGALAASAAAATPRATVAVRTSAYGKVLVDGRGFVLYAFTRDSRRGRSTCSGACARAWPPYLLRGAVHAGAGTKRASIATIGRADGSRQVTYGGRPLYYYVGDREPGQILCQNVREFGGLWLVVRASGKLVRGS